MASMIFNDGLVAALQQAQHAVTDIEQQVEKCGWLDPVLVEEAEKRWSVQFSIQRVIRELTCDVTVSKDGLIVLKGDSR